MLVCVCVLWCNGVRLPGCHCACQWVRLMRVLLQAMEKTRAKYAQETGGGAKSKEKKEKKKAKKGKAEQVGNKKAGEKKHKKRGGKKGGKKGKKGKQQPSESADAFAYAVPACGLATLLGAAVIGGIVLSR